MTLFLSFSAQRLAILSQKLEFLSRHSCVNQSQLEELVKVRLISYSNYSLQLCMSWVNLSISLGNILLYLNDRTSHCPMPPERCMSVSHHKAALDDSFVGGVIWTDFHKENWGLLTHSGSFIPAVWWVFLILFCYVCSVISFRQLSYLDLIKDDNLGHKKILTQSYQQFKRQTSAI